MSGEQRAESRGTILQVFRSTNLYLARNHTSSLPPLAESGGHIIPPPPLAGTGAAETGAGGVGTGAGGAWGAWCGLLWEMQRSSEDSLDARGQVTHSRKMQ